MPRIWDYGVYGLVYDGRKVDLTNKVDYITSSTKIVIFRKSGGYSAVLMLSGGMASRI